MIGMVLAGVVLDQYRTMGKVYTVRQITTALAHNPADWNGRTVHVRGRAYGWLSDCCGSAPARLLNIDTPGAKAPFLSLVAAPIPPLMAIRSLPLIGHLIPGPQHLRWSQPATYLVQLVAQRCRPTPCTNTYARLVDAAPW